MRYVSTSAILAALLAGSTLTLACQGEEVGQSDPLVSDQRPSQGAPEAPVPGIASPSNAEDAEPTAHRSYKNLNDPFYGLLNFTNMNEPELDNEQLAAKAHRIVQGTIESISDGRTIDFASGPSNPLHTAVLKVRVQSIDKGPESEHVYVEYIRGGIPIEQLADALEQSEHREVKVFLHPADTWDTNVHKFVGQGRGLESGQELFRLVSQRGLSISVDGDTVLPLDHGAVDPSPADDEAG